MREDAEETDEELLEDSSSSGRVTPADGFEEVSVDKDHVDTVCTSGQVSFSRTATVDDRPEYLTPDMASVAASHSVSPGTVSVIHAAIEKVKKEVVPSNQDVPSNGSGQGERPSSGVSSMSSDTSVGSE